MQPSDIRVGRTYRAKRPGPAGGYPAFYNDRTVTWISGDGRYVQYDGPAVAVGRLLPKVKAEQFANWACHDITDALPAGEYEEWKR